MNLDVALSIQVLCWAPLYSKGTMTKPIASGMARIKERIQMETISMAVIKGIPIPWTRLQEATALYLKKKKAGEGGDGTKLLGNLKLFQLKIYKYWKVSPLGKWPTTGFLGTFCESWCEKRVGPWRFPRIWKSIVWQVWVWVLHLEPSKTFWVWSVAASDRCAWVFSPGGKTGWWKG